MFNVTLIKMKSNLVDPMCCLVMAHLSLPTSTCWTSEPSTTLMQLSRAFSQPFLQVLLRILTLRIALSPSTGYIQNKSFLSLGKFPRINLTAIALVVHCQSKLQPHRIWPPLTLALASTATHDRSSSLHDRILTFALSPHFENFQPSVHLSWQCAPFELHFKGNHPLDSCVSHRTNFAFYVGLIVGEASPIIYDINTISALSGEPWKICTMRIVAWCLRPTTVWPNCWIRCERSLKASRTETVNMSKTVSLLDFDKIFDNACL